MAEGLSLRSEPAWVTGGKKAVFFFLSFKKISNLPRLLCAAYNLSIAAPHVTATLFSLRSQSPECVAQCSGEV